MSDAQFIDEMDQLLLTSTTSTRISPSIRGIKRHYIQARRNMKERIHIKVYKSIYLRLWTYCLYFLRVFTLKVVSILYPVICYTYYCLQNFLFKRDFLWYLDLSTAILFDTS